MLSSLNGGRFFGLGGRSLSLQVFADFMNRAAEKERDPINQARVKMLVSGLLLNLGFMVCSIVIYSVWGPPLQLSRSVVSILVSIGLLFLTLRYNLWRLSSHILVASITLLIWSNLLVFVQGVNIPTLQFVFIVIVYTFYVHGLRWGLVYAALNVLPVLIYTVLDGKEYFALPINPQQINRPAFIFVICYNFSLIIFLHYHFFKAFIKNISEVTRSGEDLRALNERLTETMAELEISSNARINFLSTMSHELRTPLNGVIGLSNVLLLQNDNGDQQHSLKLLKFSAQNLLLLINDILNYNKLQSDNMDLENIPFNLSDLVQNICGGLHINAEEKGIKLLPGIDPRLKKFNVYSDPTRITQVLTNLINNALKFTQQGSVKVNAEIIEQTEVLRIRFSVKDTGIGIPHEQLDNIFQPFVQASKCTTRQFGGTGLGLAIVKNILDLYKSDIKVNSTPGAGTEFLFDMEFRYQLIAPNPPRINEQERSEERLGDLSILVAEDNDINTLVVKKLLAIWNLNATFARNGAEAVKLHTENHFDLILMDLHMPEVDGYEATRLIRSMADSLKANIPIIALTASISDGTREKVRETGMDDYLCKPFDPKDLKSKLLSIQLGKESMQAFG